jgi:hypothetical protein
LFGPFLISSNEEHLSKLRSQGTSASFADCTRSSDDGEHGLANVNLKESAGSDRPFDSGCDGIAVSGGDRNLRSLTDGNSAVPNYARERAEANEVCPKIRRHVGALDESVIDQLKGKLLRHLGRGEGAANEPAFGFGTRFRLDAGDLADQDRPFSGGVHFNEPIRHMPRDRILLRNIIRMERMDDKCESVHVKKLLTP